MKKKFLYFVGCVVICLSSLVHAMGEKEFQVGSTILSCRATNQQLLERLTLNQDGLDQSRLIIPSSENANKATFEISSAGEVYMGFLEQVKQLCIKDRHGKVKITKQRGKIGDKSLDDEASIKEKINRLQEGESLTALFADNNQITITFDRLMKVIAADGTVFPVRQSKIMGSRLIAEIMTHDEKMAGGEVKLASSKKEIKMFLDFVKANEKEREKITNNLSTFEHIELVAELHYHFISKKLLSDCWDQLITKIYNSLKEGELEWFAEISSLPKDKKERVQGIMREVLNEVIKPASPKIMFKKEGVASCVFSATKNLIGCINKLEAMEIIDLTTGKSIVGRSNVSMQFSPDSTKVTVKNYGDDKKGEIIDLTTGKSIVVRNNVEWMVFSPDGTKVSVKYYNHKGEIIDLITGESIVARSNVEYMVLSPDSTKVSIKYYGSDKKREIIDLATGESIVVRSNASFMKFSPDNTKIRVSYYGDDKKEEIIDLATGESIVVLSNVSFIEFSSDGTKVSVKYYNHKGEIIDLTIGESIVVCSNVLVMGFSPDSTKVSIKYYGSDKKREIIDLATGESIIVRNNVVRMEFSPDSTKVIILSKNGKMEIVDLVDCDCGINFALFTPEQLLFVFNLKRDQDYLAKIDKNKAKQIWQSFTSAVQEILQQDYFPEVSFSFD